MAYVSIQLRPNVGINSGLMPMIAKSTCLHFDAWMMRDSDDKLYVQLQARQGGRELIGENWYAISSEILIRLGAMPTGELEPVTIQDKALWPDFERLNRVHWAWIQPLVSGPLPRGYKSRSVALHYIRAPSLDPMTD